ncbi:hypothetical protein [Streptomyces spirodelae]|uniref:TPM domain-containing protein n=1 Tax=Streptomyces spirodelae TaxID=2812904 RepID=A0ABS3WUE1_9ACTN|nr:hypothetical protein [Streptomyces spirodelae]MBO8186708.1 hypothetical protein [Streptomyces spirodelae]
MSTELRAAPGAASTRPSRAARLTAAVLALVLAALASALGTAGRAAADGDSPAQRIVDGLRKSPVYVDPSYEQAFPTDQQRRLVKKIKASGLPVRVVVVPFISGDAWDGDPEKMVDVVRYRLGEGSDKEAVYMTLSRTEGFLNGYEFPRNGKHQAFWGVAAVGHQEDMKGKSLYAKFTRALEIVKSGNGDKAYEKATKDLQRDRPSSGGDGAGSGAGGLSPVLLTVVIAAAAAVLLAAVLGYRTVRTHRARTSARAPFTSPRSVFATARKTRVRDLRKRAQRELLAYNEELLAHEPSEDGADGDLLQLSLDAYAAAGKVLDEARDIPDLAGVLALIHEGRGALRRSEPSASASALPLCFFHPLHGPAAKRVSWRPLGRRESLDVAACADCAAAVAARRAPEVLTQAHGDVRQAQGDVRIPYFEVPPESSLWAATGYGSLTEDTLTERVLRGDFTRTSRRP